jgi:hypothetical protein
MNASTHKLLTAGCAYGNVGKEPSGCCCAAKNVRARSTEVSTCRHSSDDNTFFGKSSARVAAGAAKALSRAVLNVPCAATWPDIAKNISSAIKMTVVRDILTLENRQKLIGRTERHDH